METFPWHVWQAHENELRFHSAAGRPGRVVSGRLLPGCDLLSGILEMARAHEIRSAWVSGFGSLARAFFSPGVRRSPSAAGRVERIASLELPGPIEMWSGMGRLGVPEEGEPFIHFHGMLVTPEGQLHGGHFFQGGNNVYITFEVHLQEILDVAFRLERDDEAEMPLIEPKQTRGEGLRKAAPCSRENL
jgi:predicted DNA-binding protein with PD1-like motif